jgi:hypothetical protein
MKRMREGEKENEREKGIMSARLTVMLLQAMAKHILGGRQAEWDLSHGFLYTPKVSRILFLSLPP